MKPTEELPEKLSRRVPKTLREVFENAKGSAAGFHAVSSWLECPERSRLAAKGITRAYEFVLEDGKLNELDYGTLVHEFRALRLVYGHSAAMSMLEHLEGLSPEDYIRARLLFDTYELTYPEALDPIKYIGVEAEVVSDVGPLANVGEQILRTVRYDTVGYLPLADNVSYGLFSIEAKTMARSGQSSVSPYRPQAAVQVTLWNSNPMLVARYGKMSGVIFDCYVKTQVPSVERRAPEYVTTSQQKMAAEYMAAPGRTVLFAARADGKCHKNLHACWGRWRPCQYIAACWEESYGEYRDKNGELYLGD